MTQYQSLLKEILENGEDSEDRTGVGTRSIVGAMRKYDMVDGFPLVTTREVPFRSIVAELLWLISGKAHVREMQDAGFTFWNSWADENGYLETSYARYWRSYPLPNYNSWNKREPYTVDFLNANRTKDPKDFFVGFDQLAWLINEIKTNPTSRRLIVTAWYPPNAVVSRLPPCHHTWQVRILNGKLNLILHQRSADVPVGVVFNVACYSLLLKLLARECGYEEGTFTHFMVDAHIYHDQIEGVKEQLTREPFPLCGVQLPEKSLLDLTMEDVDNFKLIDYISHPRINYPVAV